jgi:hypothetical protein
MATHSELRRLLDLLASIPTTEAHDRRLLQVLLHSCCARKTLQRSFMAVQCSCAQLTMYLKRV